MKRYVNQFMIAALLFGNPAVIMPMEEQSLAQVPQNCAICVMEVENPRQLSCGHSHCAECLQNQVERGLRQWQDLDANLICPVQACRARMNEQDVRIITGDEAMVHRLQYVLTDLFINRNPNMRRCVTPNCEAIYEIIDRIPQTHQCPGCHQQYCSHCRHAHAHGQPCNLAAGPAQNNNNAVVDEQTRRAQEAERQYQRWVQQNTRPCPGCSLPIEKNEGCNHMTCQRRAGGCGYEFCWRCLGRWQLDANHPSYYECRAPRAQIPAAQGSVSSSEGQHRYHRRRDYTPLYIIVGTAVATAASYGAYKLYKHLNKPKPVEVPNLKTSLENLNKEAMKARMSIVGPQGYVPGTFKAYFVAQQTAQAFKDLDAAKIAQLKTIVDDLEAGLRAGNCDKQYAALVNFMIAFEKVELKPVVAHAMPDKPVVAEQPRVKQTAGSKRPVKKVKQVIQKKQKGKTK